MYPNPPPPPGQEPPAPEMSGPRYPINSQDQPPPPPNQFKPQPFNNFQHRPRSTLRKLRICLGYNLLV